MQDIAVDFENPTKNLIPKKTTNLDCLVNETANSADIGDKVSILEIVVNKTDIYLLSDNGESTHIVFQSEMPFFYVKNEGIGLRINGKSINIENGILVEKN